MNEVLIVIIVLGAVAAAYLLPSQLQNTTSFTKGINMQRFWREALGMDSLGTEPLNFTELKDNNATEIAALKKRIEILEAIVTDGTADLKRKIDNL